MLPDLRVPRRPRAEPDEHPLRPARRLAVGHARGVPRCSARSSARRAGRDAGALRRAHARRGRPARGRGAAGATAARLLRARPRRARDRRCRGSINVESLERIGARNVAAEGLGGGSLARVSLEQVLAWDPEVIVTRRAGAGDATSGAIRSGAACAPCATGACTWRRRIPFPWIDFPPSVNRLIGLWWLGRVLYPRSFPSDLRAQTRDVLHALLSAGTRRGSSSTRLLGEPGRPARGEPATGLRASRTAVGLAVAAGALLALVAVAFMVGRFPVTPGELAAGAVVAR